MTAEILGCGYIEPAASWTWRYTCIIPAVGRLRQEDEEFKASLGYTERPYQRKRERERQRDRDEDEELGQEERR
jgi:hypothetical protein